MSIQTASKPSVPVTPERLSISGRALGRNTIIIAVLAMAAWAVLESWYTIDQGERGVVLTNGALTSVQDPGLHFKIPFIQEVHRISTRQAKISWTCPRDNSRPCNGGEAAAIEAYSRDQQPADIQLSVTFHVPEGEVADVYSTYRDVDGLADRVVAPKTLQAMKSVFGLYDAATSIQAGAKLNADVSAAVAKSVDGPVVVDSVQVEDVAFSQAYEQAVEARMTAQVEVQKREQQLAQEKINSEIAVTQANGRANSVKAEADADAYKTRIEGQAAAEAIKARASALANNPLLIELTKAERWNGQLPSSMIPGSTVPFLELQTPQPTQQP